MGAMNLHAGVENFGLFIITTIFPSKIEGFVLSIVGGMALVDLRFLQK